MEIKAIDTRLLPHKRLPVKIIHVESPLLFWVQLQHNENNLNKLERELNLRMAERVALPFKWREIKLREAIVVKEEGYWRRGLITKINKPRDRIRISLGDIGLKIYRSIHEIYKLEDKFKELPWQAIACGLAHTGPRIPLPTWPYETRKLCKFLIKGNDGWIDIILPLWEGAALVRLGVKTTNFNAFYNFQEALIRIGHARRSKRMAEHVFPAV